MFRAVRSFPLAVLIALFLEPLPAAPQKRLAVPPTTQIGDPGEQIDGPECAALPQWFMRSAPRPCTNDDLHAWLDGIRRWRQEYRIHIGFNEADYARPELAWTASSFVQPQ